MASVKVAVRVRPFNQREKDMDASLIIQMEGKKTKIVNVKPPGIRENEKYHQPREKYKEFMFDYSYWSFDENDQHFINQEEVFSDLGVEVIDAAFEGYNACVFAYGQTGSGKTFTMMGSNDNQGLIPRICQSLFSRIRQDNAARMSYRTEVSYLEIYNEHVKDLLRANASHNLKVREHPKRGPYVEGLSRHLVSDYDDIQEYIVRGNHHRTTASTNMNVTSSRSHAIFTIMFVQAGFINNMPSETVSKVHLVDLAGSERADATGATGQRLKEGAHINKSLVTLGSVISALAELSSQQQRSGSLSSGSNPSLNNSSVLPQRPHTTTSSSRIFIPYRDSVLTWLLKDSLGGNSKTIMIATISPADVNYGETLSTLRYANRAKNIINKPTINEDPNVKLIRELREEISILKALMLNKSDLNDKTSGEPANVLAQLEKKQAQEKVLSKEWHEKWHETQLILQEQKALGLRKSGLGVVLDSDMPHLVGIDDDLFSTGVTLYHLKEGETLIGTEDAPVKQDIILNGSGVESEHCSVVLENGVATLYPKKQALCRVNTVWIDKPIRLSQGCIILLGRTNMFRFNDPVEVAKLRKEGSRSQLNLSRMSLLSCSSIPDLNMTNSTENISGDENSFPLQSFRMSQSQTFDDDIEMQRSLLEREKETFLRQQQEKERQWQAEQAEKQAQLDSAQRQLEHERAEMEADFKRQCIKLADDWCQLEEKQRESTLMLKRKELELKRKRELLEWERNEMLAQVDKNVNEINDLEIAKQNIYTRITNLLSEHNINVDDCLIEKLISNSKESLLLSNDAIFQNILEDINPETIETIKDLVNQHKKELAVLEQDLQNRLAILSSRRNSVDRIENELANIQFNEESKNLPNNEIKSIQKRSEEEIKKINEKKQSFHLNLPTITTEPKINDISTNTSISSSKDITSPLITCDTYHTASTSAPCSFSSPTSDKLINNNQLNNVELINQINSNDKLNSILSDSDANNTEHNLNGEINCHNENNNFLNDNFKNLKHSHDDSLMNDNNFNDSSMTDNFNDSSNGKKDNFNNDKISNDAKESLDNKNGKILKDNLNENVMMCSLDNKKYDDTNGYISCNNHLVQTSDGSSSCTDNDDDDDNLIISSGGEGESNSSTTDPQVSTATKQRHYKTKSPEKIALHTMKRLYQKITRQRAIINESLEEKNKDKLNEQINILQDLQKQYVELEISLDKRKDTTNSISPSSQNENGKSSLLSPALFHPLIENNHNGFMTSTSIKFRGNEQRAFDERNHVDRHSDEETTRRLFRDMHGGEQSSFIVDRSFRNNSMLSNYLFNNSTFNAQLNGQHNASFPTNSQMFTDLTDEDSRSVSRSELYKDITFHNNLKFMHSINELPGLTRSFCESDGYPISVPSFVLRGTGTKTHYEYEIHINLQDQRWSIMRRYRRFRELHLIMRSTYGSKIDSIPFPPRQLFFSLSEKLAEHRRVQLQNYLRQLLMICSTIPHCPLYIPLTPESTDGSISTISQIDLRQLSELLSYRQLLEFSNFFQCGLFEMGKYGTS